MWRKPYRSLPIEPSRCPHDIDLEGTIALVAGATRGAGRGIAVSLGEAGATVYCTGRSTRAARSEYDRPETIEETAELVTRGRRHRHRRPDRPPRARPGQGARRAHRRRAGPARRARQRRLGRREAVRVGHAGLGARPRQRPAPARPRDQDAPDHQPLRAAAADPQPRRAGGRDDRRHRGVQRRHLPHQRLLRPRQERRHPARVRAVEGPRAARRDRRRPHARAGCARR